MLANRTIQAASGGLLYQILKSLRFRSSAAAYLSRTPTVDGSFRRFTLSFFLKRGTLNTTQYLVTANIDGSNFFRFYFDSANRLCLQDYVGATVNIDVITTRVFRDPSAWYHIVLSYDFANATQSERFKIWVNGDLITSYTVGTLPLLNAVSGGWNRSGVVHQIGALTGTVNFDGYIAGEFHHVNDQALTPSSFGQVDPVSGVWSPKRFTGTYGTNGFYLDFNDTTSVGALGYDKNRYSRTFSAASTYVTSPTTYTFTVPTYSSSIVVTLWGGGGGGGGGGSTFGNSGNNGGASTFLTLSAGGGGGGTGAWTANPTGVSGSGGTATGGDINTNGNSIGTSNGATTGAGAPNGGGNTTTATANAEHYPGTAPGGAGTGGRWAGSGNPTGGAGGSGAYVQKTYAVGALTPGTVITVTVGGAGAGGASDADQGSPGASGRVIVAVDGGSSGNDWVPTNVSLTSGITYDSMLDVPLGGGGNERGNYAVINWLQRVLVGTITGGNLDASSSSNNMFRVATLDLQRDTYYECLNTANTRVGLVWLPIQDDGSNWFGGSTSYVLLNSGGALTTQNCSASQSLTPSYSTGNTLGLAWNATAHTLTLYVNNVLSTVVTVTSPTTFPHPLFANISSGVATNFSVNFGQRPFTYTPPTGFLPLHTGNLPVPAIRKSSQYFDTTLYTGNGSSQSVINSASMQPDLVWLKNRSGVENHQLFDSVRGANKALYSNLNNQEGTDPGVSAFNTNGFSLGGTSNTNTASYVAWQWKMGATPGFDIVTYTGNGVAGRTISHNLGAVPKLIITKPKNSPGFDWMVYHATTTANGYLLLNQISSYTSSAAPWNNTAPTSSVFTVGSGGSANPNGVDVVAYLFAEVPGFSKIGGYIGNGSTDGPFIYCGFRPKFILLKRSETTSDWYIHDATRDTHNYTIKSLFPNSSAAENGTELESTYGIDFVSNGFKIRASHATRNTASGSYIFVAFAEAPFKNSLAR